MAFFIDSAGNVVEGPDDARTAAALGYAPATDEQVTSAQANAAREAEFSATGSLVRGELEGAARGLTFGASDFAARVLGADAEDMAARREFSSGVGEFAGAIAPIVLSGGTGALGSAARLAPTAVLSGVSERAGAAVAKRLFGEAVEAGALKTMARGAVQGGVTEVVEGVPYGASELLTEASIGDEELSAEKVAGHLGLSAVLGGALGAGFGGGAAGVGVALKKAGESLGGLRDRFVREYPGYIAPRAGTTPEMVEYVMGRRADLDAGASMKDVLEGKFPTPEVPVAAIPQGPIPPVEFRPDGPIGRPAEGVPLEGEWASIPGEMPPKFEPGTRAPGVPPPQFAPDPVPAEAMFGSATPTVLGKAPKAQYAQDFRKAVDASMADMEELSKRAHKEMRDAELAPLVNANTPVETAQQAAFDLSKAIKEVEQQAVLNGPEQFNAVARAELEKIHAGLVLNIAQPGVTAYDVFRVVDDTKRLLRDEIIGPLSRAGAGPDGLRDKRTVDAVQNLWGRTRDMTQDTSLWGDAAAKHAQMNAASHAYMVATENFLPRVTSKIKGAAGDDGLRRGAKKVKQGSTKKAESFLSNPAPEDLVAMRQWLDAAAQYRDAIEARALAAKADMDRLFGDEALANVAKTVEAEQALKGFRTEQISKAQAAKEARMAFKEQEALAEANFQAEERVRRKAAVREREWAKASEDARKEFDASARKSAKEFEAAQIDEAKLKAASFKADIEAGEADYATRRKEYDDLSASRKAEIKAQDKALRAAAKWNGLTDTVGAMISVQAPILAPLFVGYRAMKYMGSPDKAIRTLAMLERYAETISAGIDTAADLLVRGKAAKAGRVIAQLGINHDLLSQWSNDPETLVNALNEQTEGINGQMPRLANGVQMTTARAAQHLASKLPKQPDSVYPDPDWEPSDAQMAGFNRALAIADDPTEILALASRNELTNADIETAQAIYPALLNDIRVRVVEAMARNPEKPPYKARQQLSRLLGQDVTGAMPTLVANQAAYEANPAPAAPAPPRSSTERSTRMMTPLQQAEVA